MLPAGGGAPRGARERLPGPPARRGSLSTRSAGLLLHVTSLPGRFGIGDLGPEALRFLDWAKSAGQSLWQILPLGPTGFGTSPYGTESTFAGNPLVISPEGLVEDGYLPASALDSAPVFPAERVDWPRVREWKESVLRLAWARGQERARLELEAFREAPAQRPWLSEWTLYAALTRKLGGAWPRPLWRRDPKVLAAARRDLAGDIAYQEFLQMLFFRQWERLLDAAHARGISVVGDVPIYVPHGSTDVWARPELWDLNEEGRPNEVAGVPPDFFSKSGQLWGYPLYRWDRIAEDGFSWWIERMRAAFRVADVVRLDHFRAFAAYWAVPAADATAVGGSWKPGPGRELFDAVRRALGDVPMIAEDLGTITDDVRALLDELALPGMKVLQFAFYETDSPYLPHRHVRNAVVYTGTHDNDTARGWWSALTWEERQRVYDYLGATGNDVEWDLIRAAYASVAERAIVPVQDVFGLGSEARMNTPALAEGNWSWRARAEDFRPDRAERLARMARLAGRVPPARDTAAVGGAPSPETAV